MHELSTEYFRGLGSKRIDCRKGGRVVIDLPCMGAELQAWRLMLRGLNLGRRDVVLEADKLFDGFLESTCWMFLRPISTLAELKSLYEMLANEPWKTLTGETK